MTSKARFPLDTCPTKSFYAKSPITGKGDHSQQKFEYDIERCFTLLKVNNFQLRLFSRARERNKGRAFIQEGVESNKKGIQ